MYEKFIKEWLLSNQSRVYSVIVSTYQQKIIDLRPTLFRKWLAKEIDIPEEKINLSSLNSALSRHRKSSEQNKQKGEKAATFNIPQSTLAQSENFHFSSVDNTPTKSRTTEL